MQVLDLTILSILYDRCIVYVSNINTCMHFKNGKYKYVKVGTVKIFITVHNTWTVLTVYFISMVVVNKIENIKIYTTIYTVCVCRGK